MHKSPWRWPPRLLVSVLHHNTRGRDGLPIRPHGRTSIRRLKRVVEKLLLYGGPASAARVMVGRRALVLAYHNIVPAGERPAGDRSLHLPLERFCKQLDLLESTCDTVPLASLLEPNGAVGGRPRLAITFDDAYRGAVTVGVPELVRRGLPATIFVAPAFVGGGDFWWDALSDPATGVLPGDLRRRALTEQRGDDGQIRAWAAEIGVPMRRLPAYSTCASEHELAAAAGLGNITVASHSWGHQDLRALSRGDLARQLEVSLGWLRERYNKATIPWLSYPYGLSSPAVARAAAANGYAAAVENTGGRMRHGVLERFSVPRLNVAAGLSVDGLALRIAGVLSR